MSTTRAWRQRSHTQNRARERFGIDLTRTEYEDLCTLIRTKYAEWIRKTQTETTCLVAALPDGRMAKIIYNVQTHRIATVMLMEMDVCPKSKHVTRNGRFADGRRDKPEPKTDDWEQ